MSFVMCFCASQYVTAFFTINRVKRKYYILPDIRTCKGTVGRSL